MSGLNIAISLLENPKKNLTFASVIPKIKVLLIHDISMSHEAFVIEELALADKNSVKFFVRKTKV